MARIVDLIETCWRKTGRFVLAFKERRFACLVLFLGGAVLFAHLFHLAGVPTGLYLDESSIGYNAGLLAQTGADEHGVRFPVFFEAFGEYKNPVYIYTAALIFKLFGVSEFNLRLTSFVFFAVAWVCTAGLAARMFPGRKTILLYVLLSFGFLPHFFTISRLAFEAVSQLAFVAAGLLLIWRLFEEGRGRTAWPPAVLCGLVLGVSVYTYTTARLLTFLMLAVLWVIYLRRENLARLAILTATFLLALLPYGWFALAYPDALTKRFDFVSYLSADISWLEKAKIFALNLLEYWSPGFLIKSGDANLRHATGYGGVIFTATLALFLLGVVFVLTRRRLLLQRFNLFLLANLLLAPMAAALTSQGTPHALRSQLMSLYVLLFSGYGLLFLAEIRADYPRRVLTGLALLVLVG
ncbi:MAG: hypothetical protein GYA17_01780, partial [Chloroflexi bacterium]|nr:hypothetical protein [Chloroflexota bacterium]